jgi:hypothetical protein
MKRLSIYLTRTHSSIEIETETSTRDTRGKCVADVLDAMHAEDRNAVARLASAIVDYCERPDASTRAILTVGA